MRTLLAVAGVAVALGLATPAQADPVGNEVGPDGSVLAALDQAGVPYKSGPVAISVGSEPTAEPATGPTLPPTGFWPMFPWPTPGAG